MLSGRRLIRFYRASAEYNMRRPAAAVTQTPANGAACSKAMTRIVPPSAARILRNGPVSVLPGSRSNVSAPATASVTTAHPALSHPIFTPNPFTCSAEGFMYIGEAGSSPVSEVFAQGRPAPSAVRAAPATVAMAEIQTRLPLLESRLSAPAFDICQILPVPSLILR